MLASVSAPVAAALAFGPHWGFGFGWGFPFFFLIPLFWIALIVVLAIVFTRRRRWAARNGYGPWGNGWGGPWHGGYGQQAGTRSAESTLAERFAQGDIEEAEYRARLEVLRANSAHPPQPPQD